MKIAFESIESESAGLLNDLVSKEVDLPEEPEVHKLFNKGKTWRIWKKIHNDCMKSQLSFSPIYLGISNTLGLGSIISVSNKGKDIEHQFNLQTDSLPDDIKKRVFETANHANCTVQRKMNVSFDFAAQANMVTQGNGELETALTNARNISVSMGSWQLNLLPLAEWQLLLERQSDQNFKDYLRILFQPGMYIISKEIRIKDFSLTFESKTDLNAALKAQLEQGIIKDVAGASGKVKFTLDSSNSIKASSVEPFVVFADISVPRKIAD